MLVIIAKLGSPNWTFLQKFEMKVDEN